MTAEIALKVGMAVGIILSRTADTKRVVIGKDTRLSGYMIESALVAGFTAVGVDAFLLGPVPTPAISMLCRSMRADVGVMISASHNPYYDNGIKIFGSDGVKFSQELESQIEELVGSDLLLELAVEDKIGRVQRVHGDIYRYIEFAKSSIGNISLSGMRVVLDCANGAAYKAAPCALWELGAEVITIHNEPNGYNINQACGSTDPTSLIKKVKETRADIGIAFDGDADRMLVVDEKGRLIDGDQLVATLAANWLAEGRLRGGGIVATIMSNLGLERFLHDKQLHLIRTPVGDRHVSEYMRKNGYNLGGEPSGHIILSDYATTGDGLIAALQILSYAQKQQKPISELCLQFETVPQLLKNIPVRQKNILEVPEVKAAISAQIEALGSAGRLIVRASGTEPLIRIMVEGDNVRQLQTIIDNLSEVLERSY